VVHKSLRHHALVQETGRVREGHHGLVGRSPEMERLREQLARLSGDDVPVWLWGEVGTGRELAARSLHARAKRSAKPFFAVPCAALGPRTWESELGLDADGRVLPGGLLERLDGGTLYLQDLPALSPDLQSRLLRSLVDPDSPVTNGRILASSSVDPRQLVEQGRLLEGVFTLLGANIVELVSLRERAEDIPVLARHFISTICAINHLRPIQLADEALGVLERYHWPENVQGLRNVLEQAVILCPDGEIRLRDLPDWLRDSTPVPAGPVSIAVRRRFREAKREVVEAFERSYLRDLMEHHGGNVTAASQESGMLRSALQRLLRKYDFKSAVFRRQHEAKNAGESTRH